MWEWLANFLTQFLDLFRCAVIVREYERGIVLRFGKLHRTLEPGFHWVWPLAIESPLTDHVVTTTSNTAPQSLTTADGIAVTVAAVVTWRVSDIAKLLLEVESHTEAMRDATLGVIAKHVTSATWADLKTDELAHKITIEARRRAKPYGIQIESVSFSDCARCRSLRIWTAGGAPS